MRHRLLVALSALTLLLGLGVAGTTAASAAPAHTTLSTVTQARTANDPGSSPQDFCAQDGTGYCLNRAGCGSTDGVTHVIVWTSDLATDGCEDFQVDYLTGMCNQGRVSSTCP